MLSFVKVVELGGFASAARQLNLANSVVTDHSVDFASMAITTCWRAMLGA
jgi:hypothetical protein